MPYGCIGRGELDRRRPGGPVMADSVADKARRASIEVLEHASGTVHTGTRAMLIQAGLATPEQFPGEPGCGKTSNTFSSAGGRKIRVARRSTYLFDVEIYRTEAEKRAYRAQLLAELDCERRAREDQRRDKFLREFQELGVTPGRPAYAHLYTSLISGRDPEFASFIKTVIGRAKG